MKTVSTIIPNAFRFMQNVILKNTSSHFKNAAFVSELSALDTILQKEKNIAIYERAVTNLTSEVEPLLQLNLQLRYSGTAKEVLAKLSNELKENNLLLPLLFHDIQQLLYEFDKISGVNSFRLQLLTVNSNMCRRFHTDINDLRLLCTYNGQGTFWLPDEAANRNSHHEGGENEEIVLKPKLIQQANTGDVLILKGALYPEAKAVIHRSPSIEESGEKRLLLRIDTNNNLIF